MTAAVLTYGAHTLCFSILRFTSITSKAYTNVGIISPILQIKKMIPGKGWNPECAKLFPNMTVRKITELTGSHELAVTGSCIPASESVELDKKGKK